MCPFRHISGEKTVVCKHWLRGLCKKGDQCEFLHEYDMTKMPECYFYSKFGWLTWVYTLTSSLFVNHKPVVCKAVSFSFVCWSSGECSNKECPFLHIDPDSKIKDCPWYDRGFCKHGEVQLKRAENFFFFMCSFCSVLLVIRSLYHLYKTSPTLHRSARFRSRLPTQTHEKSDLCELPGGLLSRGKSL